MKRIFRILITVIGSLVLATLFLISRRNAAMNRLYEEAAGHGPGRRPTEAEIAVRRLAEYRGSRCTGMLLAIALDVDGTGMPGAQAEAIKALRARGGAEEAVELAKLLRPHRELEIRWAVGAALRDLPCPRDCISSVLDYLERVWRGEPNFEDLLPFTPYLENERAGLRREQQSLYENLHGVLKQHKLLTLECLEILYGLGSADVSPFALQLTSRIRLQDACPLLLQSEHIAEGSLSDKLPRKEIKEAVTSLACR